MAVVINGDTGISPVTASGTSASVDGMTVGRGGGEVSTNTAVGASALNATNTGGYCLAVGTQALYSNTSGTPNTAIGYQALYSNTTSGDNVAVGHNALYANNGGNNNTAMGDYALRNNTTASNNTAVGYQAGYTNTTGSRLTVLGYTAGYSHTTGSQSTFIGAYAGYSNTGSNNTFVGDGAGYASTTGTRNTFIGVDSGVSGGAGGAITTGSKNTIIGGYCGNQGSLDIRTASNYIVLSDGDGNPRGAFDSNGVLRLGDVSVAPSYAATKLQVYRTGSQIRLVEFNNANNASGDENVRIVFGTNANNTSSYGLILTTGGADKYYLYGNGTYGTVSDRTLKKNIETTRNGYIDDLCKLRVVKYNWTTDEEGTPKELGWIAQEVEEVFPNLVQDSKPNEQGEIHKQVKTSVLPFMLLKAIQELKTIVDAQAAEIAELKAKG